MRSSLHSYLPLLGVGLALGVVADWLFLDRWIGISAPLFVAACLLSLVLFGRRAGRPATRANLWLGGAALVFSVLIAVRDEPMLVALNIVAVLGLLLLQVMYYRSPSLARLPLGNAIQRALMTVALIIARPPAASWQVAQSMRGEHVHLRRLWPLLRGLLLALPVLLCFMLLLNAADSVFASYSASLLNWQLPFDADIVTKHIMLIGTLSWLCAGALLAALGDLDADPSATVDELPAEGATQRLALSFNPRILGAIESLTVLALVDLLFGSFMLIQAAYFFGGLDTLARTGDTYAEYARRGFFELLAVACLSLGLLWTLALLTKRALVWQQRAFNTACGVMIVLVVGILASAFQRMLLYEEAYGFTRLRIYTHSFMIWLAVILALFLVALLHDRPRLWSFGTFVAALIYLVALNVASPDALIVRANVARYAMGGTFDAEYLADLSADAASALLEALPRLDPTARATIAAGLNAQSQIISAAYAAQGWPSWQWARWQAMARGGL